MKKYIKVLVLILIVSTSRIKGVRAESFYEDNWITGVYANLIDKDFSKPQLMRFIRRKSDNRPVYCITPRVLLYEDEVYSPKGVNLSDEVVNKIDRLAYFGYGYANHTSNEWYAITQFMIWKTVEPNMDIFFTDKFNGNRITRFTNEINELNNLVNDYSKIPNIPSINMLPNEEYKFEDDNQVINNYNLEPTNLDVSINNNILYIKSSEKGDYTLNFNRNTTKYGYRTTYYKASKGQDIVLPGDLSLYYQVDVKVAESEIIINKTDTDNNTPIKDATYGLYNDEYNLIKTGKTDFEGKLSFTRLLSGMYHIQELEAPQSYQLDNNMYDIYLDNTSQIFDLKNEKIKANVNINKYKLDGPIRYPEENVTFEIYDMNDNLVYKMTTDHRGFTSKILKYGKYRIHQINTTDNYKKVADFYIDINNSLDKEYYLDDIKEEMKDPDIVKRKENKSEKALILSKEIELDKVDTKPYTKYPITSDKDKYIFIIVGYLLFMGFIYILASIKDEK